MPGGYGSKAPKSAREAIDSLVRRLGIGETLRRYDVLTSWEAIVGEQIAKVARPERVDNGILYVAVASAPWRQELSMRKAEIIGKIRVAVGKDVVRDIRFR